MRIGVGVGLSSLRVSTETAATAALAAAIAVVTTPLTTERRALYDAMIGGLQSDGVWSILDRFPIISAPDILSAAIDVKDPTKVVTFQGTGTFTADRRWVGNGTTGYIDLGVIPGAAGNFTLNSASIGVYCNLQGNTNATSHAGSVTTNRLSFTNVRAGAGNETFSVCDATGDILQANTGSKLGHRASSRTDAAIKRGYFNGTRVADFTTASTSLPGGNFCLNRNLTTYSIDGIAAGWFGGGMNDTQMAAMQSRLHTFMTAIGANY